MYQKPFAILPIEVALDHRLTLTQQRVLIALFSFRGHDTGLVWPSRESLSRRCGIQSDRISRATTALERLGWLVKARFHSGRGGVVRYRLAVPPVLLKTVTVENGEPCLDGEESNPALDEANPSDDDPETCPIETEPAEQSPPEACPPPAEKPVLIEQEACPIPTGPLKGREVKEKLKGSNQYPRAGAREASPLEHDLPHWIPQAEWEAFIEHRKAMKHPLTKRAIAFAITTLSKLREAGNDPVDVIQQTIVNDWRGFFPVAARGQARGKQHRAIDWFGDF